MGKKRMKVINLFLLVCLLMSIVPVSASAEGGTYTPGTWPSEFTPYTWSNGSNIYDPANEPGISPDDVDFTSGADKGIGDLPSFYVASDTEHMFFRVRLKGNPYDRKGGFLSSVWLVQLGVGGVHKATVGVFGKNPDTDFVYAAGPNAASEVDVTQVYATNPSNTVDPATGSKVPGTRIVPAENGHYFLDFQVPKSVITGVAPDIDPATSSIQLYFATSKAANLAVVNKDGRDLADAPFKDKKAITLNNVNPAPASQGIQITQVDGKPVKDGETIVADTATPALKGTIDGSVTINSNSRVKLFVNGADLGEVLKGSNGNGAVTRSWTIPIPSANPLRAGQNTAEVRFYNQNTPDQYISDTVQIQYAAAGGTNVDINIDRSGPGGAAMPTVHGTTEAGNTVKLKQDGLTIATIEAEGESWSYTLEKPLSPKDYVFSAEAADSEGNVATASTTHTVGTGDISISIDNGDEVTLTDDRPTIRGRTNAPAASQITLKITDRDTDLEVYKNENVVVQADRTWFVDIQDPLAGENYRVDASVNDTSATDTQTVKLDTTTEVTVASPAHRSVTAETTPEIKGMAEPAAAEGANSYVSLKIDSSSQVTVRADADGKWSYTPSRLTLGEHTIYAKAYDANGNEATAVTTFHVASIEVAGEQQLALPVAGQTKTSTYSADVQGISDYTVTWSVYQQAQNIALDGVTIDGTGRLTVAHLEEETSVRVVAALADNPEIKDELSVTLTAAPAEEMNIEVTGAASLQIPAEGAATSEYQAKDGDSVLPNSTVTWSVYQPGTSNVPVGVSIDAEGVLQVAHQAAPGTTVRVAAALKADPEQTGYLDVELTAAPAADANLDGWTGSQERNGWAIPAYGAGDSVQLRAVSDESAAEVTAELNVNTPVGTKKLTAQLAGTSASNGQKQWRGTIRLPDDIVPAEYAVTFATNDSQGEDAADRLNNKLGVLSTLTVEGTVSDSNTGERIEGATVKLVDPATDETVAGPALTDANGKYTFTAVKARQYQQYQLMAGNAGYSDSGVNFFAIPAYGDYNEAGNAITVNAEISRYQIVLTASPSSIRGDGMSTTVLQAAIKDPDGKPVPPGIVVSFTSPYGSFPNGSTARTDENGTATLTFRSEAVSGASSLKFPVTMTVNDEEYDLTASKQIWVTFEPGAIEGVVWETKGNRKITVSGALVEVIQEEIGFYASQVTGDDGKYAIGVPEGNKEYLVLITKTVSIGGTSQKITFRQSAAVGAISNGETYKSNKVSSGLVLVKDPVHHALVSPQSMFDEVDHFDKIEAVLIDKDDPSIKVPVTLNADGTFNIPITVNGRYDLVVRAVLNDPADPVGPDRYLTISTSALTVNDDGEMNIVSELVDPYGTVRDSVTNAVIPGARVNLFYANTDRNKDKGILTDTKVTLPPIAGFAPNDNASPLQLTDAAGFYAYMVYPETDYYITVEKEGYVFYKSEDIPVEWSIVQKNVWLDPIPSNVGGGGNGGGGGSGSGNAVVPPAEPKFSLNLSVDKNLVEEEGRTTITIDYRNESERPLDFVDIRLLLPDGVEVVDADGGRVGNNAVTWTIKALAADASGQLEIVVKWPKLNQAEASFAIKSELIASPNPKETVTAQADSIVRVYSNRFGTLQHQRYILGYPDGEFKPARSLTRAELAAILARLTENVEIEDDLKYTDIAPGHWAANYIKIVTKHGYFHGFADGTFRPEEAVTRGELATVMTRFLGIQVSKQGEWHFNDIEGHWAAEAIEQLYRNKFVSGYPDGSFKPNDKIVRSEAVTLINRMLYRGPLHGLEPMFPDIPESHWAFGQVQEATQSHESTRNLDGSEAWLKTLDDDVR
ncbi:S-layer homology domain-containing protein [Paenibacillus thermotolerans]|uniref:S-layer homology domain-containing protein n=1 Tax=Paenibacillus thermotolerans TaxID=3027807 RepID=UPI002368276F|nr:MULTISPECIES: S-layer homology domain-containing protein [unclassified Paenibacillus]